jgi:hypothetical protein
MPIAGIRRPTNNNHLTERIYLYTVKLYVGIAACYKAEALT